MYCVPQGTILGRPDGEHRNSGLKKSLAIRIDVELLAATRDCARRDNRSLTNFIETALRRRIEEMTEVDPAPDAVPRKGNKA